MRKTYKSSQLKISELLSTDVRRREVLFEDPDIVLLGLLNNKLIIFIIDMCF